MQLSDDVTAKMAYSFNKDRFMPSGLSATTFTDTSAGRLFSTFAVDPQAKKATLDATVLNSDYGTFSTSYVADGKEGGRFGPLMWKSLPMPFPFAKIGKPRPMSMSVKHDIAAKSVTINMAASICDNFDAKLDLLPEGEPVVTLIGSRRLDKDSVVRASGSMLDLLNSGVGKGALGVAYSRDLDTGSGSSSRVQLDTRDTGDFAWSLTNTTPRMTLVLFGKGKLWQGGEGKFSSVSIKQSLRLF
ncbi:unnamed protein product [Choristocarpus tenellus]